MTVDINTHEFKPHNIIQLSATDELKQMTLRVDAVSDRQVFVTVITSKNPEIRNGAKFTITQDPTANPRLVEMFDGHKPSLDSEALSTAALMDVIAYRLQVWLNKQYAENPKKGLSYAVLRDGLRLEGVVGKDVTDATLTRYLRRIITGNPGQYIAGGGWVRLRAPLATPSGSVPQVGPNTRRVNKQMLIEVVTKFAVGLVECGLIDAAWEIE